MRPFCLPQTLFSSANQHYSIQLWSSASSPFLGLSQDALIFVISILQWGQAMVTLNDCNTSWHQLLMSRVSFPVIWFTELGEYSQLHHKHIDCNHNQTPYLVRAGSIWQCLETTEWLTLAEVFTSRSVGSKGRLRGPCLDVTTFPSLPS